MPRLLRALTEPGVNLGVASAELRRPTLDDVFLALTGRSLREEHATATTPTPTTTRNGA